MSVTQVWLFVHCGWEFSDSCLFRGVLRFPAGLRALCVDSRFHCGNDSEIERRGWWSMLVHWRGERQSVLKGWPLTMYPLKASCIIPHWLAPRRAPEKGRPPSVFSRQEISQSAGHFLLRPKMCIYVRGNSLKTSKILDLDDFLWFRHTCSMAPDFRAICSNF